ncbi:BrnA antitoxin family protein [Massilia sp. DWR3-1-1]|uniref:BrnA antitoxin family protein n=1 Tax=Massilia sp. DWR3-1-1 TaxID=2804559 RepID=UPI003CF1FA8F
MDKDFSQEWDAPRARDTHVVAAKHQQATLKQIVTIRLDTDTLDWFKGAGPGYQTRINQILRQYMAEHRDDAPVAKAN